MDCFKNEVDLLSVVLSVFRLFSTLFEKMSIYNLVFNKTFFSLDSMLAVMFNHTDQGLAPMPKTKEGAYFLEADPIYFREILNYLRYGQSTEDPDLFRGVKNLADYLGL